MSERSTVLEIFGPCAQVEILDQPDSASVIRQIPKYNIANFAYHGFSNWRTPLEIGLILQSDTGASLDTDNLSDTESSSDYKTLILDILSVEKILHEQSNTRGNCIPFRLLNCREYSSSFDR